MPAPLPPPLPAGVGYRLLQLLTLLSSLAAWLAPLWIRQLYCENFGCISIGVLWLCWFVCWLLALLLAAGLSWQRGKVWRWLWPGLLLLWGAGWLYHLRS